MRGRRALFYCDENSTRYKEFVAGRCQHSSLSKITGQWGMLRAVRRSLFCHSSKKSTHGRPIHVSDYTKKGIKWLARAVDDYDKFQADIQALQDEFGAAMEDTENKKNEKLYREFHRHCCTLLKCFWEGRRRSVDEDAENYSRQTISRCRTFLGMSCLWKKVWTRTAWGSWT